MEVEMNGVNHGPKLSKFENEPADDDPQRTCDAMLSGALVNSAFEGHTFEYKTDLSSLRLYYVYRHWSLHYLLFIFLVVIHLLAFWENIGQPRHRSTYDNLTLTVELLCLTYFIIRLSLRGYVTQSYIFWHDPKTIVLILTIGITLLDITGYLFLPASKAYRWSICLRPIFIITFAENQQIRRAIRSIRNTLPDIFNVLILFFLSLGLFSLIGFKLFNKEKLFQNEKVPNRLEYFDNYIDSFYQLYILVTTANNPKLMMPAYNISRVYALFFVVFIIINLYLFMNIILAVIYNNYRKHLKNEVRKLLQIKRDNLSRAYDIITKGDENGMTREQLDVIMDAVFQTWPIFDYATRHNTDLVDFVWSLLESNGRIKRSDFMDIGDLMSMKIRLIYQQTNRESCCNRWLPFLYATKASRLFCSMVKSRYFRYTFDLLICLNLIIIAVDSRNRQFRLDHLLLTAFTFEILAKLYAYGFEKFTKELWNLFDSVVIGLAGIFLLLINFNPAYTEQFLGPYLDIVLVLRVLRICKIIGNFKRFYVVVTTIRSLMPSILTYGGILVVVYYAYAIIGMQLFHGLIYPNPKGCSTGSIDCCPPELSRRNVTLCTINFNTISSSFLFLFDLMMVNEWHTLALNLEILTNSKYTRFYFFSFHLFCVIIVLNIFAAFVIEAFILEYTNTTEGSAYLNRILTKVRQLGVSSSPGGNGVTAGSSPKKSLPGGDQSEDLVNSDFSQYEEFNAYGIQDRKSSIFALPEKPQLKVQIHERVSVEALLIRMFQKELEMECVAYSP